MTPILKKKNLTWAVTLGGRVTGGQTRHITIDTRVCHTSTRCPADLVLCSDLVTAYILLQLMPTALSRPYEDALVFTLQKTGCQMQACSNKNAMGLYFPQECLCISKPF